MLAWNLLNQDHRTHTPKNTAMIRDTSGQDIPVQHAKPKKRKLLLVAGTLVGLALLSGLAWPSYQRWSTAERSYPLARLRLGEVVQGQFVRDAAVQGKIVAASSPTLYSPTTGTVTLHIQAGDSVKKDELLATLASPELVNELERESASLAGLETELGRARIDARQKAFDSKRAQDIARVTLAAAEREMRRADDPLLRQALSQLEYEKIRDELVKAGIENANAIEQVRLQKDNLVFEVKTKEHAAERQRLLVQNLKRRLDELNLRSPVDGMVGSLHVVQKAVVPGNTPIATVVDLGAYAVELDVPESYADDLGIGMETEISINGQTYAGTVSAISPEVKNNLVNCRVGWKGEAPPGLRQNQRLSARILIESRDQVLTVPRGPFLEDGGGRVAYVVNQGIAEKRQITTGATSVGAVEIIDGLKPGERVVLSSTEEFRNAETVRLTE